ncbi:MAG: SPOR domain-containing protein [Bacteroidia bacterium]|nr:SPOR domain-containing protein [Bacteroidia bacterium]MCF8426745.1 SPOR domain-containing protein [Bacteroidia bacterium]MCF8446714.1 SPOR domain-containing protein [Bacteroidia bacterium]
MKKLFGFILILLVYANTAQAQGKVKIIGDPSLDSLIEKNIEENRSHQTMDGFRIQLFSGSERNNANALKAKFKQDFPDEPSYLIYQQPYFKLRVGDYRNFIEAQQMYLQLQKVYDQLLIVPDKINLPKL